MPTRDPCICAGMGDSDSQWSPIWELSAAGLGSQMDRTGGEDSVSSGFYYIGTQNFTLTTFIYLQVHAYFTSDTKQGAGEPTRIASLDRSQSLSPSNVTRFPPT